MTDDNGRDLSAYPKPGVAESGFIEFGPASARRAALDAIDPEPRPALNPENYTHAINKATPLAKAGPPAAEYAPTPLDRIATALERIALTLERTDI